MFVDVGLSLALAQKLNRWRRNRSLPRGVPDVYYRGVRMEYNLTSRVFGTVIFLFVLSIGGWLFLGPDVFAVKPRIVGWLVKIVWIGFVFMALLAPLQAFRDFVVVNDDGLLKSDLFGRMTRLSWDEITGMRINLDENDVIFSSNSKTKIKMNLCYNGWQDFLEIAAKRLAHPIYQQLSYVLAGVKPRR